MSETRGTRTEDSATIPTLLQKLALEDPQKPAFICWDKHWQRTAITRQEIWDRSRRFAAVLRRLGIARGDIVCNTLVNSQERLITCFGTLAAGAVCMQGQTLLADGEDIIKNWKESRCKAVIVDPQQKKGANTILEGLRHGDEKTGEITYRGLPQLSLVISVTSGNQDNAGSLLHALRHERDTYVEDGISNDDTAFILTTSGSTGFSKLVPHTHRSIIEIGRIFASFLEVHPDSMYFNHRSFGWMAGIPIVYPVAGITRVFIDLTPGLPQDVGALLVHVLESEKCDCGITLPPDIQLIMNSLEAGARLTQLLRIAGTGGGPLSTASMAAIGRITECVTVVYGSTEMGLIFFLRVVDEDSYENTCVGYPGKSVQVKIVGEDMRELSAGDTGDIYVRGPTISSGYLNDPVLSKESFLQDGWYRTFDIGHMNSNGQLFVYCRKSNAINHKGFIHYPGWLEAQINRHPDIQKCIVVGIPEPVNHEDICLCIVKTSTATLSADDVREFCKNVFMTGEENSMTPIPQYYVFLDSFPLTSNGKIDRKALRVEAIKRVHARD